MSYFRALLLVCFGLGLFVQVAAQAAAMPQPAAEVMDCSEMMQRSAEAMGAQEHGPDENGPCKEMALDCLVPMNCLPPLTLVQPPLTAAPLPAARGNYPPALAVRLEARSMRPESPPPQLSLTA